MADTFGDDDIGGSTGGSESGYVAQLGRVSGKLLKENLLRNGVPLTFRNGPTDDDILYLDVNNMRVGINTDSPDFDLDINSDVRTTDANATLQAKIDNVVINASGSFTTLVGSLNIIPTGLNPVIEHGRMTTDVLTFNDNVIGSINNGNIVFDPNASGTVEFLANSLITGNLAVSGNITVPGNLSSASTITIGNNPLDIVIVAPDLTQSIIPGQDNNYDLGANAGDSSERRWSQLHTPDLTNVGIMRPDAAIVSAELRANGLASTIFATQSNSDIVINPDTGVSYIEQIRIEGNNIGNLLGTRGLDPTAIAIGINQAVAGDPTESAFWNQPATGIEIFTGGGSTLIGSRTSVLGDIRNDLDNPGILNSDDATTAFETGSYTASTLNEQLWYHTVIKPQIYASPSLYATYGNGVAQTTAPMTLATTGTGYVIFEGDNGIQLPAGTTAERQYTEVGETRWNTDLDYLECFDGNTYIIATGPGEVVSRDLMIDLAITRALVFG